MKTIETMIAEQATGCVENPYGMGKIYAGAINRKGMVTGGGEEFSTLAEIQNYMREGGEIAIPNAGAGSYRKAFAALGFERCKNFENTSSAGDWSFAVYDGQCWFMAFQSNRFPRHGYCYSVNFDWAFDTITDCFGFMAAQ